MLLARLPRLRDGSVPAEDAFSGTFHVNETYEQLEDAYDEALSGRLPSPLPCEIYCHSLTDPSILGPGVAAHTLTLFALHTPARLFARDREAAGREALAAALRSLDSVLAEPIEDCLLRAPDGEPCLEAKTPLDLEDELALPGGNIFHRDLAWPFAEDEAEAGALGDRDRDRERPARRRGRSPRRRGERHPGPQRRDGDPELTAERTEAKVDCAGWGSGLPASGAHVPCIWTRASQVHL